MSRLDEVLPTTARVTAQAGQVRLREAALEAYAASIPLAAVRSISFAAPFHYRGPDEALLDYIVALDTVNFGSGWSHEWPGKEYPSIYKTVAAGLKRVAESGVVLDGRWMSSLDSSAVARIFGLPEDFALVTRFRESLNEVGTWLEREYGGQPAQLIEAAGRSARRLVDRLAETSSYRDVATWRGGPVWFLKRAQILCADLYQAFEGRGWGRFEDIDRLTCFADNAVPKMLHADGLLEYDPGLEARIRAGTLIEAGSEEEIELRAFAVQTVEKIRQKLEARGEAVLAIEVDWWLWHRSQDPHYRAILSHRTRTMFY